MIKITVGASRNNKIGSKLIRWWLDTDYSHVYFKWHLTTQNTEIVYQASHGLVHFISYENFIKKNSVIREFEIELTEKQFKDFSKKCINLAGQKYATLELLQIVLVDMTNGKFVTQDQSGYICSELVGEFLNYIGFTFNKPKFLLTPKDIIETLENIYGKT